MCMLQSSNSPGDKIKSARLCDRRYKANVEVTLFVVLQLTKALVIRSHALAPKFIEKVSSFLRMCLLRTSDFVLPCFNAVCYGKLSVRFLGSKLSSDLRNLPTEPELL